MSGKIVYLLAVLALAAVVSAINDTPAAAPVEFYATKAGLSHHLITGSREPGDRLVVQENVVKPSAWLQIVTLTKTFTTNGFGKITQVRALDQKTNGNGATAALMSGGPGADNVTLRFKSKRGHSINFVVEVYSKPW